MPTPAQLNTTFAAGLAFDKSQNLWVQDGDGLARFTHAQLKALKTDPSPTPGVQITSTATFKDLARCAFDHKGNLWVADSVNDSIDGLSKAQLDAGSGDVTPAIVITSTDLEHATFVTFDKAGNAWVVKNDHISTIAEFTASQLTSGGSKSASVVLSSDGAGSIDDTGQIVFDDKGNLWVPNLGVNTVVEFAPSQLAMTGNPTPTVILNSARFDGPWALAFDSKGDLVVVNYEDGSIDKFSAKQIKVTGAPIPEVSVTGNETENAQITFGPAS